MNIDESLRVFTALILAQQTILESLMVEKFEGRAGELDQHFDELIERTRANQIATDDPVVAAVALDMCELQCTHLDALKQTVRRKVEMAAD